MKKVAKNTVPTAADRERMEIVSRLFDDLAHTMEYLAGRWADESEYEDIADYKAVIEKAIKKQKVAGLKITRMTSRPFGFHCTFRGCTYRFTRTMRKYEYARIA